MTAHRPISFSFESGELDPPDEEMKESWLKSGGRLRQDGHLDLGEQEQLDLGDVMGTFMDSSDY